MRFCNSQDDLPSFFVSNRERHLMHHSKKIITFTKKRNNFIYRCLEYKSSHTFNFETATAAIKKQTEDMSHFSHNDTLRKAYTDTVVPCKGLCSICVKLGVEPVLNIFDKKIYTCIKIYI